jgi:hypothetical protein
MLVLCELQLETIHQWRLLHMATESQSLLMVSNFIFFLNKKNQMGKKYTRVIF